MAKKSDFCWEMFRKLLGGGFGRCGSRTIAKWILTISALQRFRGYSF